MTKAKKIILLIFIISAYNLYAQEEFFPPDYTKIKQEITDSTSVFYYPPLVERYIKGDTSLNFEDYHFLYYGYSFHKFYRPSGNKDKYDSLFSILAKKEHDKEIYHKLRWLAESILETSPFELRIIDALIYAYQELGKTEEVEILLNKRKMIMSVIGNSGDGLTCDKAIYVINPADINEYLKIYSFSQAGNRLEDKCQIIELSENKYKVNQLYFNISPVLESINN